MRRHESINELELRRLTGRRLGGAIGGLTLVAVAVLAICPLIGMDMDRQLGLLDPADVLGGALGDQTAASRVFFLARLPRILAAFVVGAGLAAAGCAFQAGLRNPLAEPFTLGISSGSALFAVIAIRFGLDQTALGGSAIGASAFVGSAVTVYAVWRLGRVGTSLPPATLLLAGITLATISAAATMLIQYTADFSEIGRMVRWMMGGLDWIRYTELVRTTIFVGVGVLVLLYLARDLNALSAGPDAAASVGVNPRRSLTLAFAVGALIVGATIAIAGPIGFIGLMVPHAMRGIVGPDHRALLPASMLTGGVTLAVCDTIARVVLFPSQLPVGVVTALLGGSFFLYLLVREKSRSRLWGGQ